MLRTRIHRIHRTCIVSAMLLAVPCFAIAQQAAAPATPAAGSRAIPPPDELEPGVNTTPAAPAAPSATAPTAAPAASARPAPTAAPALAPAADASAAKPAPTGQNAKAAKATARKGPDRLDLDPTDIKGNRELPKVLYIVPWKRADLGDVVGKPVNSLLDEVLQPLDRDVFKRENRYYDDLKPGAGDAKAGAAQGSETKP
jgi:type IV secretory pathway VirB10-like protein